MSMFARRVSRVSQETGQLYFDGRFQTTGVYTSTGGNFSGTYPPPFTSAQYVPSATSYTTIYTAGSKPESWWPDPFTPWSSLAGAFTSYNDNTQASVRAQALGGWAYTTGSDFYVSWVVYVPSAVGSFWPNYLADSDWNVITQLHGAPFNGSPIIGVNVMYVNGGLCLVGGDGSGYAMWSHPLTLDTWTTITLHIVISSVGGQGLLEAWVNGQRKTLSLPRTRPNYDRTGQYLSPDGFTAHIATELADSTGTGSVYMNCYRKGTGSKFGVGSVTFFHAGIKIGSRFHTVQ